MSSEANSYLRKRRNRFTTTIPIKNCNKIEGFFAYQLKFQPRNIKKILQKRNIIKSAIGCLWQRNVNFDTKKFVFNTIRFLEY